MNIIDPKIMKKLEIISEKEIKENCYKVISNENQIYYLEVSDIDSLDHTLESYRFYKKLIENGVPTIRPIKFDIYEDKVYTFFKFVDFTPLSEYLKTISERKQYELGIVAGRALRNIHNTTISVDTNSVEISDVKDIYSKLKNSSNKRALKILKYVEENIHLLNNRQKSFLHGDYSINSFGMDIYEFFVFNFDKSCYDDKYKDFLSINFNANISKYFTTGELIGYFDKKIPVTFFNILALYKIIEIISDKDFDDNNVEYILALYDNMTNVVPKWYQEVANSFM